MHHNSQSLIDVYHNIKIFYDSLKFNLCISWWNFYVSRPSMKIEKSLKITCKIQILWKKKEKVCMKSNCILILHCITFWYETFYI